MAKSNFASTVAPTLTSSPATVSVPAIDPNTKISLTYAELQALLASAAKPTPAAKKNRKTPAVVTPAPVSVPAAAPTTPAPTAKADRGTGIGFFSTGKVCMLTCQDGKYNATATVPPAGASYPVLFPERATMKDGVAIKLPEEIRHYSVTSWKRNSKNTGWIALFPKKV